MLPTHTFNRGSQIYTYMHANVCKDPLYGEPSFPHHMKNIQDDIPSEEQLFFIDPYVQNLF